MAQIADDEIDELLDQIEIEQNSPRKTPRKSGHLASPLDIFSNSDEKMDEDLPEEIRECLETGINAALAAGTIINKYIDDTASKSQSLITKMTKSDFQTQFDRRTEQLILGKIKKKFANYDHEIVAEESTADDAEIVFSDKVTWVIDPIDGTTNFLHGHNNVAVCIGLKYKKKSVMGITFIPLWNELFFAVKGKGAYIMYTKTDSAQNVIEPIHTNKKHRSITTEDEIGSAMFLIEFGYRRDDAHCKRFSEIIYSLLSKYKVRGIRMFGSCGVHMCCVACGRADVFFEFGNLKPWDMVAGEVIVTEAGGHCSLINGDEFDCTKKEVLCGQSKGTNDIVALNILKE